MSRSRRLRLPSLAAKPAGQAGGAVLVIALLAGLLALGMGVGYSVSRPILGDGSVHLLKGHSLIHFNGESKRVDAEYKGIAEGGQKVRIAVLPDGRLVLVNTETKVTTIIDAATMKPVVPDAPERTGGEDVEPIATDSGGYLVDKKTGTVRELKPRDRAPAPALVFKEGVMEAVPAGASLWVLDAKGGVNEVLNGQRVRRVVPGGELAGLTVADGRPVAVTTGGRAYAVAPGEPSVVGELGLAGKDLKLGSWRGAGRYVLAVDPKTRRVVALDPRSRKAVSGTLPKTARMRLDRPVVLGDSVYVPDRAVPKLWKFNAVTGRVEEGFKVNGRDFQLEVSDGRVWANDQYERRALTVDESGDGTVLDKGEGDGELKDSSGGGRDPLPDPVPTRGPKPSVRPSAGPPAGPSAGPSRPDRPADPPQVEAKKAPGVEGLHHGEACRLVRRAGLECERRPAPGPVTELVQLGVVTLQQPDAGVEPADGKVAIAYPDKFVMPTLTGLPQGGACAMLTPYGVKCVPALGQAAVGQAETPGAVYDQNPPAGRVVGEDTEVRVVYYSGVGTIGDYAGPAVEAACAQVQADGFECQAVEGVTAAGTGSLPRQVYAQDPAPGIQRNVREPVVLRYYSGNNQVPPLAGLDPDAACAALVQAEFTCENQHQLAPNHRVVNAQSLGAGTSQPIGSPVTITWSPYQPVPYSMTETSPGIWTMVQGAGTVLLGYAYPPNGIPDPSVVNRFQCGTAQACTTLPGNLHYTRNTAYNGWVNAGAVAGFMKGPCLPGAREVFRVWKRNAADRPWLYSVTDNPAGWGAADQESLGCVWAP